VRLSARRGRLLERLVSDAQRGAYNDYTNLVFSGFFKEYSTVGNYLKEKIIIKNKMSDGSIFGLYSLLP